MHAKAGILLLMRLHNAFVLALLFPVFVGAQAPGSLSVEARSSASSVSIPPGAQRVAMLTLTLSAACDGDVLVNGLTLIHKGMGAVSDITGVYAESEGRRISRVRSFSSREGVLCLDFRSFSIPACGQAEIVVRANFSASAAAAGEHDLIVAGAGDIDASVPVTVRTSSSGVYRTVGPTRGTVTVTVLSPLNRVSYGDHRMIGRLRITVDGVADQELSGITLTNRGSASDTNLQNITAELRGQSVSRALTSMDGDLLPLVFDPPLILTRGGTWLIDLRANVRSGIRKTISLTVEESGDVSAQPVIGRR